MAKQGDPNHGPGETFDFTPEDLQPNKHYERPQPQHATPDIKQTIRQTHGLSTLELATYLLLILIVGLIGFFITPLLPDEIAVQITLALVALLRQKYLSK